MDKEKFEKLIFKFHNKELSSEEKVEFESFLSSSDEARKIFHQWNLVYKASQALSINKEIPEIPFSLAEKKTINWRRWLANSAAIITIPLILGFTYLLIDKYKTGPVVYNEVAATNAKVVNISLPDGSKVSLYAGSTLKYPDRFSDEERLVILDGEGTFEVKPNPKNPFYVETTDGTRVKAYGTKFSVRDYDADNTIQIGRAHV